MSIKYSYVPLKLSKDILNEAILPETQELRTPGLLYIANIMTSSKNSVITCLNWIKERQEISEQIWDEAYSDCEELLVILEGIVSLFFYEVKKDVDETMSQVKKFNSMFESVYEEIKSLESFVKGLVVEYTFVEGEIDVFKKGKEIAFEKPFTGSFSIDNISIDDYALLGIETVIFTVQGLCHGIETEIEVRLLVN